MTSCEIHPQSWLSWEFPVGRRHTIWRYAWPQPTLSFVAVTVYVCNDYVKFVSKMGGTPQYSPFCLEKFVTDQSPFIVHLDGSTPSRQRPSKPFVVFLRASLTLRSWMAIRHCNALAEAMAQLPIILPAWTKSKGRQILRFNKTLRG